MIRENLGIKLDKVRKYYPEFDFLKKTYKHGGGIWSVRYFVSTVGLNETMIRNCVRYQEKEDLRQARLVSFEKPRT